jgi:hypothetical protein
MTQRFSNDSLPPIKLQLFPGTLLASGFEGDTRDRIPAILAGSARQVKMPKGNLGKTDVDRSKTNML